MEKGFYRRLTRPLAGAFLAACLAASLARSSEPRGDVRRPAGPAKNEQRGDPRQERSRTWWEVALVIAVKGEYVIAGFVPPTSGAFAYRARWSGRLELDSDGDFLLVHLATEVLDWTLKEKVLKDGRESLLEARAEPRPALRMEYIIKDGTDIEFVFGLGGLIVPLHAPELAVALDLPRSSARQPGPPGHGYGDFVRQGSCRVAIPEADLTVQAPERSFSWDWSRERELVRAGRTLTLSQKHTAEAAVTVRIH